MGCLAWRRAGIGARPFLHLGYAMNRRECLKGIAVGLASFILPAPRPRIDLAEFCATKTLGQYDLRLPYEVNGHTFACDSHICVRVAPSVADEVQSRGPVPPFHRLPWDHDELRGWRSLPKLEPIMAANSVCPECNGTGYERGAVIVDCNVCDGTGTEWIGSVWDISRPQRCRGCKGSGNRSNGPECATCGGQGDGVFPSLVELHGQYLNARLYAKAQRLGGEFVMEHWPMDTDLSILKFSFDGGDGMLMGIDRGCALRAIEMARR